MRSTAHNSREQFEPRVRRNIAGFAVAIAREGEGRRKNGIDLAPGEFTTRDAEVAALAGNHMRQKAREVIEAMTAEGLLVVTRTVERGKSQAWVIRRASPALLEAERRAHWEPDAEAEEAFTAALDGDHSRCVRVLRSLERRPVIEARAKAPSTNPGPRKQAKRERIEALSREARRVGYVLPDDLADESGLNQLLHEPPSWLWRMGEPKPGLSAWLTQQDALATRMTEQAEEQ